MFCVYLFSSPCTLHVRILSCSLFLIVSLSHFWVLLPPFFALICLFALPFSVIRLLQDVLGCMCMCVCVCESIRARFNEPLFSIRLYSIFADVIMPIPKYSAKALVSHNQHHHHNPPHAELSERSVKYHNQIFQLSPHLAVSARVCTVILIRFRFIGFIYPDKYSNDVFPSLFAPLYSEWYCEPSYKASIIFHT